MNAVQNQKRVVLLSPQFKNNGAFVGNSYVDVSGWNHLRVEMIVGTTNVIIGSTDTAHAPKLEADDDSGFGTVADVVDAALSAVIQATDSNKVFAIDVNLRQSHPRFFRVNAPTAGNVTGANLCIIATLSDPQIGPDNAADQGLAALVQV
ncbi:MAG: hypothetical protein ABR913_03875 [Sedimentisphaerales bacterium]|jgi:hypothetical protein